MERGGCFTKANKTQNLSESLNMTQVCSGRAPDCDGRLGQFYQTHKRLTSDWMVVI